MRLHPIYGENHNLVPGKGLTAEAQKGVWEGRSTSE